MASTQAAVELAAGDANRMSHPKAELDHFTSHTATFEAEQLQYTLRVLKMCGSTMIFISAKDVEVLEELAVGMPMRASSEVIASTIIGQPGLSPSSLLASQYSKRFGRQFFISLNVNFDRINKNVFLKELISYIDNNVEEFT